MAPRKSSNKGSKSKILTVTHTDNTNTNNTQPSTSQNTATELDNINQNTSLPGRLPAHFASLLKGTGTSTGLAHKPLFKGASDTFYLFQIKLRNWIMIHDLEDFLDDDDDDDSVKNLCLFVLIIGCLDGDPLHLVSTTAKGNGKLAYTILEQKYMGTYNARKSRSLNEVIRLKQLPNEDIPTYISRMDIMVQNLQQFSIFNDTSYYVMQTLQGLLPKYEMFKTCINSTKDLPTWSEFKIRIQNYDQLTTTPAITQNTNATVMNVAAGTTPVPQILKKRKVNFKKHLKKNTHMQNTSIKHCTYCNKSNHYEYECFIKNPSLRNAPTRGTSRGRGRGRGSFRGARGNIRGAFRNGNSVAGRGNRGQYQPYQGNNTGRGAYTGRPTYQGNYNGFRQNSETQEHTSFCNTDPIHPGNQFG